MLEQKTAEEIATATAVMNSLLGNFNQAKKQNHRPRHSEWSRVSLSEDALETAFALLSNRVTPDSMKLF